MDRGLEVLDDEKYTAKITPITTEIAENIYHRAFVDHSLMNECENGVNDTRRIWWVQAETVIGFLNRYQKDSEKRNIYRQQRMNGIILKLICWIQEKVLSGSGM